MSDAAEVGQIVQRYAAMMTRLAEIEKRLREVADSIRSKSDDLRDLKPKISVDVLCQLAEEAAALYQERFDLLSERRSVERKMGDMGLKGLIQK